MTKEDQDLLQEIKTKINKRKYHITLLCGGYLLKRDINTNEIVLVTVDNDEYEQLAMQYNEFHMAELFCLESWDEIENGTINDDGTRRDDGVEKKWLLELLHPGMTAKQAWKTEVKEYKDYLASAAKSNEPVHIEPKPINIPIKSKPIAIKVNEPIPESSEQRLQRIKNNIYEDFGIGAFHNETLF